MASRDHARSAEKATQDPRARAATKRPRRTRFRFDIGDAVWFKRAGHEVTGRGRFVTDDEPAYMLARLDGRPLRPFRFVRQQELAKLSGDAA